MNPASKPLVLPLTFPNISQLFIGQACPSGPLDVVQASCSAAKPSILVSWGLSCSSEEPNDSDNARQTSGLVMGCKDGSFYIFHASLNSDHVSPTWGDRTSEPSESPPSPFNLSRHSRQASRSATPALLQTPFHITPRSAVVSGLSTELVEAPKNFVDFEEEPDKLKDMLKGKVSKDKSSPSFQPISNGKTPPVVQSSPTPDNASGSLKRKNAPRSLLSATNSPSFSPILLSAPPSPGLPHVVRIPTSPAQLLLRCHTIPSRSGPENPIAGMCLANDSRLLVTLHSQGELSVFRTLDGACLCANHVDSLSHPSLPSIKRFAPRTWRWTNMQTVHTREHSATAFLVHGKADNNIWSASFEPSDDTTSQKQTRLVMFECRYNDDYGSIASNLEKLGDWHFDGPINGVGVKEDPDDTQVLIYVDAKGNLVSRRSKLSPFHPPVPPPHEHNAHSMALPLPNPFTAIMSKSNENVSSVGENKSDADVAVPEEYDMGAVFSKGFIDGLRTQIVGNNLRCVAWSDQELVGFETDGNSQQLLFASSAAGIYDVTWVDDNHYTVIFVDRVELYALVDANNGEVAAIPVSAPRLHAISQLVYSFALGPEQTVHSISATEVLFTNVGQDRRRDIRFAVMDFNASQISTLNTVVMWKVSAPQSSDPCVKIQLSSILPVDYNRIILGYDDGRLRQSALSLMMAKPGKPATMAIITEHAVDGYINAIYSVQNDRTKERFIVGGTDDGSIAFWSLDSLQLCARWIVFTSPLHRVVQFQDEGPLQGCVLCISLDGTIAVIAVDEFQFLYLIPGSMSPLSRICLNGDNLLLIYKDIRIRMWCLKTKEFWRSMTMDKAEELISQEGWSILSIEGVEPPIARFRALASSSQGLDSVSTVLLDLERFVSDATVIAKSGVIGETRNREGLSTLNRLRLVLSTLLTPGVSEDIDEICRERLGVTGASHVSVGFSSFDHTCLFDIKSGRDSWCISPEVSAARALSVVAILRAMALFEEISESCNTVMTFYTTALASAVGPSYQAPSPIFLAQRWFDGSNEIRQAARILFDSAVTYLPDEDSSVLVEKLQHHLPSLCPAAERDSLRSALALFVCGNVAALKYSVLSTSVLAETAKCVTMYLHDEQSGHRALAIDLSSRGFQVWQNYVDAMEMLRDIMTLATNNSKSAITTQNVSAHARLAILQIVSSNTPLFMATMGLDILHPRSVEHRKSVLQIFAFLIRKRPLMLYPNLPRLMEAVVKSLDPNSTASREAVLDTATEILGHVVKTFPTVDFHMTSQRLAVGTNEGAIVMYDLKTATRLFVLEGHHKRLAACSFSGDGRRLVSVSLEESMVLVWKVGSSFSSFFHPGAPPRQGSGGSSPFRTLSFNIGDTGNMTTAETLDWVRFEWIADRSVKLKIKDNVLTFST